ncbi:hypothetical protein HY994_04595 [Candidatus Micrarchaeota archaeon]|nr:hypothetical protein [Candidatus Micrarchaeota archaeon]
MENFVYSCSDVKELKKVLDADPLDAQSFTRLGYILREGKLYGLTGYVVHFKVDAALAKGYQDKLAAVPGCTALPAADKQKVVDAIEQEENSATAGFGSLFG